MANSLRPVNVAELPNNFIRPPRDSKLAAHMEAVTDFPKRGRKKIWDLCVSQCSVVGTCCTIADLQRLCRRFELLSSGRNYSDYEIHTLVVRQMETENALSRAIQKLLDERYEGLIRKASRLSTPQELQDFWRKAVRSGLAPGAYWALITSPSMPDDLLIDIFGEVHMMSHMCGASHREDLCSMSRKTVDQDREIAHLRCELERLAAALRDERASIAELKARNAELHQKARATDSPTVHAHERERPSAPAVDASDLRRLKAQLVLLERENASLRRSLIASQQERAAAITADDPCQPCGLRGRRVLYVGGVRNAISKIRDLAEEKGGCFLHHDGGLEQSMMELEGLTSRADIVFVPVRHVSHQAAREARHLCSSRGIPFCALRSSSVSAFAEALRRIESTSSAELAEHSS